MEGWKRELLEKAGVDFDLSRVRAAMNDTKDAASKKMTDRALMRGPIK